MVCPKVPPQVRSPTPPPKFVEAKSRHSTKSWSLRSRQEAKARKSPRAAERIEDVRKKIEGECEPQPGQPGRSDSKDEKWIPALPSMSVRFPAKSVDN